MQIKAIQGLKNYNISYDSNANFETTYGIYIHILHLLRSLFYLVN